VIAATERLREQRPDMTIDREVQLDVGIVPEISARKAPDSRIARRANVLVFPDLQAGNIGSGGCSADDVYPVTAVTVVQAQAEGR
jgi:phosphate acetyltransferase